MHLMLTRFVMGSVIIGGTGLAVFEGGRLIKHRLAHWAEKNCVDSMRVALAE